MLSHNNKTNPIAAIILSGGLGTRMHGADKGLQKYLGKPLVSWVIDAIKPQVETIIISINRNQSEYEKLSNLTVFDQPEDTVNGTQNGPIAGILSCAKTLDTSKYRWLLIASCDSPNLRNDYVSRLLNAITGSEATVAVVNDGQRNQNLHCLMTVSAINSLSDYYNKGGRSMLGWFQQINLLEVDFSDHADRFANINRLTQLSENQL